MNMYIGVGRLVKDVEIRHTQSDKMCAIYTIAISRPYKNQNGEYETDFINCETWGNVANTMNEYVRKGDMIGVKGSLRTDSYMDKNNEKKYRTYVNVERVTFLSAKKEDKINNDLPEDNLEMPF